MTKYLFVMLTICTGDRELGTLHWCKLKKGDDPEKIVKQIAIDNYYGELDDDQSLDDFDKYVDCFDFIVRWDNGYTICNNIEELYVQLAKSSEVHL